MLSRTESIVMGLLFSLIPAILIAAPIGFFNPVFGIWAGICVFGFGLSMCFMGSGGNGLE